MRQLLKKKLTVLLLVFGCCVIGLVSGGSMLILRGSAKHRVESEIGADLPEGTKDLHYYRCYYIPGYTTHVTFIKFRTSKEDYLDLMHEMGVTIYDKSAPELVSMGSQRWRPQVVFGNLCWKTEGEDNLDWWDPEMQMPDMTGILYSDSGWIMAKYENAHVYIVIDEQIE